MKSLLILLVSIPSLTLAATLGPKGPKNVQCNFSISKVTPAPGNPDMSAYQLIEKTTLTKALGAFTEEEPELTGTLRDWNVQVLVNVNHNGYSSINISRAGQSSSVGSNVVGTFVSTALDTLLPGEDHLHGLLDCVLK